MGHPVLNVRDCSSLVLKWDQPVPKDVRTSEGEHTPLMLAVLRGEGEGHHPVEDVLKEEVVVLNGVLMDQLPLVGVLKWEELQSSLEAVVVLMIVLVSGNHSPIVAPVLKWVEAVLKISAVLHTPLVVPVLKSVVAVLHPVLRLEEDRSPLVVAVLNLPAVVLNVVLMVDLTVYWAGNLGAEENIEVVLKLVEPVLNAVLGP